MYNYTILRDFSEASNDAIKIKKKEKIYVNFYLYH